jgi:hypothetical protein
MYRARTAVTIAGLRPLLTDAELTTLLGRLSVPHSGEKYEDASSHEFCDEGQQPTVSEVRRTNQFATEAVQTLPRSAAPAEEVGIASIRHGRMTGGVFPPVITYGPFVRLLSSLPSGPAGAIVVRMTMPDCG